MTAFIKLLEVGGYKIVRKPYQWRRSFKFL